MADGQWVRATGKGDVKEGSVKAVFLGAHKLAIYHLPGGEYRATDNLCTHDEAYLSDGWMEDGCIECPLHAAKFDIRTGKALSAPADKAVAVFPVKLEGDDVMVNLG
jgi:nitrite reductase/ring-hydroxylating ferredoxin subunit